MKRRMSIKVMAASAATGLSNVELLAQMSKAVKKRNIPGKTEKLPIVGLGTWQTFDVGRGESERSELRKVLKTLIEMDGSVIDSSPMYGRSEQVVGELTSNLGLADKSFMCTKVWTTGDAAGRAQMNNSMQLMRKRPMDLMQVHNLVDWKTHLKTLLKWKEEGKVRYIGITHYVESAYERMQHIMKNYPIDFIQLNYSMQSRAAENVILPLAHDKNIGVLINRPFEGGSLFRRTKGKELPAWTKDIDCHSWGQFFLKYLLANPAVTCAIPGTSKVKHLVDNLGAGMGRLPDEKERKKMLELI